MNRYYYEDGIENSKHINVRRLLHRLDGPAIEYSNGTKCWYQHDKLHRLDGPAIEYHNGTKRWYINDEPVIVDNNEQFLRLMKLKAFL